MITNAQNKQGIKYPLLNNVGTVFTKLIHEGRTTVRQAPDCVTTTSSFSFTWILRGIGGIR
jgi:hypothetical protein